jgi:hypothetical protein
MPHLEANSVVLQALIATTLDFCISCNAPLSKANDRYVTCLTCDGALCPQCHRCPCDVYGVPESDAGEAELLAFINAHTLLQKS